MLKIHGSVYGMGGLIALLAASQAGAQDVPMAPPPGPGPMYAAPYGPVKTTRMPAPGCLCRGSKHKAKCQYHFLGYAEEFNEWPLGWSLYACNRTQVANGAASRLVFYRYDFDGDSARLNARGSEKLAQIASILPTSFAPVIVERTEGAELDEARRLVIVGALASGPFPIPMERVVVGAPISTGLSGRESEIVYGNLLYQTQGKGAGDLRAPTGGSGLSGAGLTGGTTFGAGGGR